MKDLDAKTISKRFALAETERQRHESIFDDAIRLTMPNRTRFNSNSINNAAEDIFDETGANAVDEFTSRMQAGLFPPFSRFVKLQASSGIDARDQKAVNNDLDQIEKFLFEEIWASNFAQESTETLFDLCISTGLMSVEDSGGAAPFRHRAIPITDFFLERDVNDSLGGFFRRRIIKAEDLAETYDIPEAATRSLQAAQNEGDKELTVIEYLKRDPFAPVETSYHYVVVKDFNEILRQRKFSGQGTSPLLGYRWAAAAGETWGRGPLLRALAAIRTTNLTVELILENAAMAMIGIYQTDNEATINSENVQLLPGTILNKDIGTDGLQPVNMSGGNFNVSDLVLQDQRLNIKRALYNDMLSDPNKTPATATEVAERMADLAHRTSAGFARVFYEFIVPYIWRTLRILQDRKDIELPSLKGRALDIVATSPLAQAQKGRDVQRLMQDFQVRSAIYGPQVAVASYNLENLHPWLIERNGLDENLFGSAKDIKEAMKNMAEQIQAAQEQGMLEQ